MKIKDNIRVLVAEDNPVVVKTIRQAIKTIGFNLVGVAANGKEAVEMALSLRPDVILMDIEMPELDGFSAVQQIQEHCSIPTVILTVHEKGGFIEKANEVGASAYLVKPPQVKEIERAIILALGRHDDLMKLQRMNKELQQAIAEIKTLRGILPLCSFCKKIRDDRGYWEQVDVYIHKYSEADISHGICPECMKNNYPEEYEAAIKSKNF